MAEHSVEQIVTDLTIKSREASRLLQNEPVEKINRALITMAKLVSDQKNWLKDENSKDLKAGAEKGLSSAMLDRLTLSDKTLDSIIKSLHEVAGLSTSVGKTSDERVRPNGLKIYKTRVPIGVIGIIYESRPNVTVDAAAICLKSMNAVILRGGSEAFHSNTALAALFSKALEQEGLPSSAVQLVPTIDRSAIEFLLHREEEIDLIIPRGGEGLIRMVVEKSRIPVIKHYKGICHVYISEHADMEKAVNIAVNAKVHRPGVCNAMETLLLDSSLETENRRKILFALREKNVTIIGDEEAQLLDPSIQKATDQDWSEEYLDLRLAVKTVNGLDDAIQHINKYGSHHTDSIVTESKEEAKKFLKLVDSSSVIHNASTRFADGGEYGMGCEIGISTDKLHSRGPMGIEDLTTYKWVVEGDGQVR
ncbi:Gamma-glutamyl phosphate reductase [Chitinispirillum alkaliphilum]|nr:Gamma-glutamyl phosphate reductase [Chitinispirillum alkaliphilum]